MSILDPQKDVYVRLTSDATLMAAISTHNSLPAVFSDYAPHDYVINEKPIIVTSAPSANEDDDTLTEFYRVLTLGVRLYHRPQGSSAALEAAAEQARHTLKTWALGAITGGTLRDVTVTGPVTAPTEDPALEGRLLQVRLLIQET
ncbi:MAG: hypothetical protein AAFU81_01545 [Pseudomonadota bacterium]